MAVQFLIIGCVALYATQAVASGFTTFASTYNTHAIQHAVAYPLGGSKVTVPAVAATPAFVAAPTPATPSIPAASTPTATSKPASSQSATAGQSPIPAAPAQLPFAAPANNVAFVSTPFGWFGPGKVDHPAASVTFTTAPAYANGPVYTAGPVYASSYGSAPAFAPAYAAAAGPANVAPANASPLGHTNFAAGAPLFFASVSSVPNYAIAPAPGKAIFSAPSYVPW